MARKLRLGTGWLPDTADERDLTHDHPAVVPLLRRVGLHPQRRRRQLPAAVDLRQWCPPVRFQGGFNTCSAHVVAGLLEFFEQRAFGKSVAASRLFLYKAGQNFLQRHGDDGIYIRQVMGVLRLLGVPPERYWPYVDPGTPERPRRTDPRLEAEPTPFCYALARDYRAVSYYRLDRAGGGPDPEQLLERVRAHLAAQMPVSMGFPLYESLAQAGKTGRIPYPSPREKQLGNHAVMVVGYDDGMTIRNTGTNTGPTQGAVLFQNSWSREWGEDGYGWLPYEFVLSGKAHDFWTLLRAEWIDTGRFQIDATPAAKSSIAPAKSVKRTRSTTPSRRGSPNP